MRSLRRIVTDRYGTRVYRIDSDRYSVDDLRRIAYHVRINRASALFARCWLLGGKITILSAHTQNSADVPPPKPQNKLYRGMPR